jgi:hypothetical protein
MSLDSDLYKIFAELAYKPYEFVQFNFPWGEGRLSKSPYNKPDTWQKEVLVTLGMAAEKFADRTTFVAISAGRGPGKTALIAWIVNWFMSTRYQPKVIVTANTKQQLETATWREIAKWWGLSRNQHWFECTATTLKHRALEHNHVWRATAQTWSEDNPQAFAGQHEQQVLTIFDEASVIPVPIWEIVEGTNTTPGSVWVVCGNPSVGSGRFYDAVYGKDKRWIRFTVDCETAAVTNKTWIEEVRKYYGEDSDFWRVHVKGQPPKTSATQLLTYDEVVEASKRTITEGAYTYEPKIMGVDVSDGGSDRHCIIKRQGLASYDIKKFSMNAYDFIRVLGSEIDKWGPDAVFIDAINQGSVVVAALRERGYYMVREVKGSTSATDRDHFFNKRAENYFAMAQWIKAGGAIPDNQELINELVVQEYLPDAPKFQMERKEEVRKKLVNLSPDAADALANTFSEPVMSARDSQIPNHRRQRAVTEYSVADYMP